LLCGLGNDNYFIDSSGDVITETADQGTDLVNSTDSHTLGTELEKLTLTGSNAISGTGNAKANLITGNAAANTLNGLAGADTMVGGVGNDVYIVDGSGDVVTEAAAGGTDRINAGASYTLGAEVENLTLTESRAITGTGNGNGSANVLNGNAGANVLDGKAGADTLVGAAGNDTYLVDDAGDVVTEAAAGGTDLVRATASHTLGAELENLTLEGAALINGSGNTGANIIIGNCQRSA